MGDLGTPYVACLSRDDSFRTHCIQNMVGSSGRQRVQNSCFDSYFLAIPEKPAVLELFQDMAEPLFKKKQANATESKSLEALRDTLLPKLISGELAIPSAEKVAMETV